MPGGWNWSGKENESSLISLEIYSASLAKQAKAAKKNRKIESWQNKRRNESEIGVKKIEINMKHQRRKRLK